MIQPQIGKGISLGKPRALSARSAQNSLMGEAAKVRASLTTSGASSGRSRAQRARMSTSCEGRMYPPVTSSVTGGYILSRQRWCFVGQRNANGRPGISIHRSRTLSRSFPGHESNASQLVASRARLSAYPKCAGACRAPWRPFPASRWRC